MYAQLQPKSASCEGNNHMKVCNRFDYYICVFAIFNCFYYLDYVGCNNVRFVQKKKIANM